MSPPKYVSKDGKLYEVLERSTVRNAGMMGGQIIQWMLLDVTDPDAGPFKVSQAVFDTFDRVEVEYAELGVFEVTPPAPLLDRFREQLERWAEEAPSWLD